MFRISVLAFTCCSLASVSAAVTDCWGDTRIVTSDDIRCACGNLTNPSMEAVQFKLTDQDDFNASGIQQNGDKVKIFGVISNEHDACLVGNIAFKAHGDPAWIRFSPNISMSGMKNNDTFLGGRINFKTGDPKRRCVAVTVTGLIPNKGYTWEWINLDCSERLEYVVMNVSRNDANGANLVIPREFFDIGTCEIDPNVTVKDPIQTEIELRKYAIQKKDSCILSEDGILKVSVQRGICDEKNIIFKEYLPSCPDLPENSTVMVAELNPDPEKISSYVTDFFDWFGQNKRSTILTPTSLLSFSIFTNQDVHQPTNFTFHYELNATASISKNAFNLTFEDGNDCPLCTNHRVLGHRLQCVFINQTTGKFDTYGCNCVQEGTRARCVSNHTTVFAVLLVVDSVQIPSNVKILSVVMQSISLFFLMLAFAILIRVRRKVRGERIAIQINLVVSLFFLNIWTLLGDAAMHFPAFCRAVAVLSHFFLISSALWMTNEAMLLFLKTSRWAFVHSKRRKVVIATMTFGWGVASIVAIVTAAVGFSMATYMKESTVHAASGEDATKGLTYDYCWLSAESGIRWAATGPVVFLLAINIAVGFKVAIFVFRKRRGAQNFKPTSDGPHKHELDMDSISASLKAFVLLVPVLGISWALMLVANSNDSTIALTFMYLNVVINGLQGVFVFFVYCVIGKEVRAATVKSLSNLTSTWQSLADTIEKRRKKSAVPGLGEVSPSRNSSATVDNGKTNTL